MPSDLPQLRRIQQLAPEAAQWPLDEYQFLVAEHCGSLTGFLVYRVTVPGEIEILNLAVDPAHRRQGAARALISSLSNATLFLEVRESNHTARAFYRNAGFLETGIRPGYYSQPFEAAIVMRMQS